MNTQLDIAALVNQQIKDVIEQQIASIDLKQLIAQAMDAAITDTVNRIAARATETMLKERDVPGEIAKASLRKAEEQLAPQIRSSVRNAVAAIDIKQIVERTVVEALDVKIKDISFPDASISAKSLRWDGLRFSGSMVEGGIIKNFNSTGIQDNATQCQLTLVDGVIVAEGHLISTSAKTGKLEVDSLQINKDIQLPGIVENKLLDLSRRAMLDIMNKDINLRGKRLLSGEDILLEANNLGPSIINSNLRKLGLLQDLRVSGDSKLSETMYVDQNGRVGINTDDPVGALNIWDDDAEIAVKKQRKRNMYIGSTRDSSLSLGTNNREQLQINLTDIDVKDPIRIMGVRFSVEGSVPDRQGEPNEIVFVSSAREGQPRFYICKGNNQWSVLESRV